MICNIDKSLKTFNTGAVRSNRVSDWAGDYATALALSVFGRQHTSVRKGLVNIVISGNKLW